MKKYCFYLIQDDFYSLFKGNNLKAFLELYYRKNESNYYEKQFNCFVKELSVCKIQSLLEDKFCCRKDFVKKDNKYMLNNFITSNKEILLLKSNCIEIETDYEVSPFVRVLSDNFPDLVFIDLNNCKIGRIGLVSCSKIS